MLENVLKKKRGRKSKKELELLKKQNELLNIKEPEKKVTKKRGRKPKGGKIINSIVKLDDDNVNQKENIILHLKCNSNNISNNFFDKLTYNPNIEAIKAYDENEVNPIKNEYFNIEVSTDNHQVYNNLANNNEINNNKILDNNQEKMKNIWNKIKELQINFNNNNIKNNSDCFWCTCGFDNPPIYIPKFKLNKNYEVYGCFCSPECAAGFLFNENIDTAIKWERYSLLNSVYCNIYNYDKNVKPAPNPYYTLDKYYGNLSINEYRKLFTSSNILIVVEKPLTRVLPELQNDNNDLFMKNNETKKYNLSRNKPLYNNNDNSSWLNN
jgi:hypothetical protein